EVPIAVLETAVPVVFPGTGHVSMRIDVDIAIVVQADFEMQSGAGADLAETCPVCLAGRERSFPGVDLVLVEHGGLAARQRKQLFRLVAVEVKAERTRFGVNARDQETEAFQEDSDLAQLSLDDQDLMHVSEVAGGDIIELGHDRSP